MRQPKIAEEGLMTRQIAPWNLLDALTKARSLRVTLNDLFLAAYVNAFYELHTSRGIPVEQATCLVHKNLRLYPPPYSVTNETT